MNTIHDYFPFSNVRECQTDALKAIETAFASSKKYFILDAETGVGKSAIGIATAVYLDSQESKTDVCNDSKPKHPGAYILTTQKILQDQYVKDFSSLGLIGLKSSSNYTCKRNKLSNCSDVARQLASGQDTKGMSACMHDCVYKHEKRAFIEGKLGVANYSYWLTETAFSGKVIPKTTLILDEAHNLSGELSKFIEINITERFAKNIIKLDFPGNITQKGAVKWIKEIYLPNCKARLTHITVELKKLIGEKNSIELFDKISRQLDQLQGHITKIENFLSFYEEDNWVFEFHAANEREGKLAKFEFKPVDVSRFAKTMVFDRADKVIFMSATILSKENFCELLGLDVNEVGYIKVESPFPLNNRPVFYSPIGKMTADSIDATLPKLAQAITTILDGHPNEKGIIHTHSYKISNYLVRNIKGKRLLTHESHNRDEVLKQHEKSIEPTVLISPSMQEGVDLKGDLSRFQIICKVPYPYLGDKVVKKRMHKWKWWYDYETLKTVVQSIGRSIRNETDFAITYILDTDWIRFASKNKKNLPENLRETLR
jgi:ATP-dependent DNA helicase DinG